MIRSLVPDPTRNSRPAGRRGAWILTDDCWNVLCARGGAPSKRRPLTSLPADGVASLAARSLPSARPSSQRIPSPTGSRGPSSRDERGGRWRGGRSGPPRRPGAHKPMTALNEALGHG